MVQLLRALACAVIAIPGNQLALSEEPPLVHEGIIEAPAAAVWRDFTTKEGLESWMVPHAEIDLRIGGAMRTVYGKDAVVGDETTIENTIISFDPHRMLSFRNTGQPRGFPFKAEIERTWSVLTLDEIEPGRTRLTISGLGYGSDEPSRKMREFFRSGNQIVLDALKAKYGKPRPAGEAQAILQLAHSLVGGEWIVDNTRPDGSIFRARSVYELGPDGQSVVAKGWLGNAEGMTPHGATQIFRASEGSAGNASAVIRFQSINERGDIASGRIELESADTLRWHWNSTSVEGKPTRYAVRMRFDEPGSFDFTVGLLEADEKGADPERQLVHVRFRRVDRAPEALLKLRG